MRHNGEAGLSPQLVRDVMTRKLIFISPQDTLEQALKLMMVNDINHLPVADPDQPDLLLGFLTRTNIMRIYAKDLPDHLISKGSRDFFPDLISLIPRGRDRPGKL